MALPNPRGGSRFTNSSMSVSRRWSMVGVAKWHAGRRLSRGWHGLSVFQSQAFSSSKRFPPRFVSDRRLRLSAKIHVEDRSHPSCQPPFFEDEDDGRRVERIVGPGVASFRTPYLHTFWRRRHPLELRTRQATPSSRDGPIVSEQLYLRFGGGGVDHGAYFRDPIGRGFWL